MEDVGEKVPESSQEAPSAPLEPPSIPELNDWIGNLMNCKQLSEGDVQRLCDKVCSVLRDRCPERAFNGDCILTSH